MNEDTLVLLLVIAERELKYELIEALQDVETHLFNVTYGKGSVKNDLLDSLGFSVEPQKVIITAFLKSSHVDRAFSMLTEKFGFNKPNTGIAFTVPVDKLSH